MDQNLDTSKKLSVQLEKESLHHLENDSSVNRSSCFLNSDAKYDEMSKEFSSINQVYIYNLLIFFLISKLKFFFSSGIANITGIAAEGGGRFLLDFPPRDKHILI